MKSEVNPTEDEGKVRRAVLNLFPSMSIETYETGSARYLVGRASGLEALRQLHFLLRSERILSAARKVFSKHTRDNKILFFLNKQAAFVKHISFCEPEGESPLGTIAVMIECEAAQALVDWLAPKPENGHSWKGTRTTMRSSAKTRSGKIRLEPSRKPTA
ncbi:MAG: RNA-binding domain-containing protein [Candidatus Bathyarchaeia archaeon]